MLLSLGRLVSAVVDGLGIQLQLDQDDLTPEGPLAVFELLLAKSMKDFRDCTSTTSE
ncbi:MAG: hypothetical protein GX624_11650 [Actinobacteria bacterium]|nr:hypothetical protein [Actinomycetota bacterium]